jgi:hyaluronoglucosaminidase
MTDELHIGPYLGRDPELAGLSRGIIANGMPLAESSKIGFASIAEFLADPAGFDAEQSWERALARVAGDDLETVREFADSVRGSALCTDDSPRLAEVLARFAFEHGFGDPVTAIANLSDEAVRLAAVAERMKGIGNTALASEASPWIAQYARAAEGLALCARELASAAPDRRRIMAFLRDLRSHRLRVHGDLVDMFLSDAAHEFEA